MALPDSTSIPPQLSSQSERNMAVEGTLDGIVDDVWEIVERYEEEGEYVAVASYTSPEEEDPYSLVLEEDDSYVAIGRVETEKTANDIGYAAQLIRSWLVHNYADIKDGLSTAKEGGDSSGKIGRDFLKYIAEMGWQMKCHHY